MKKSTVYFYIAVALCAIGIILGFAAFSISVYLGIWYLIGAVILFLLFYGISAILEYLESLGATSIKNDSSLNKRYDWEHSNGKNKSDSQ